MIELDLYGSIFTGFFTSLGRNTHFEFHCIEYRQVKFFLGGRDDIEIGS